MKRRLTRTSEGYALVLDSELLASAGIDPEVEVEVSSTGSSIILAVSDEARAQRVREAAALAHRQYGEVFRRLAQ
jgi:hypothetical protein